MWVKTIWFRQRHVYNEKALQYSELVTSEFVHVKCSSTGI